MGDSLLDFNDFYLSRLSAQHGLDLLYRLSDIPSQQHWFVLAGSLKALNKDQKQSKILGPNHECRLD